MITHYQFQPVFERTLQYRTTGKIQPLQPRLHNDMAITQQTRDEFSGLSKAYRLYGRGLVVQQYILKYIALQIDSFF